MRKIFINLAVFTSVLFNVSVVVAETVLEPFTYSEDFETRELGAWANYPHWEDTSYNEYFRVNTMVPGDDNISIELIVTPYYNVDNYAGAQKLLDMFLEPGSIITLRYYLKSHLRFEFFKVRLAAGVDGKVDYTVLNPPLNRWVWLTVTFTDILRQNPRLSGRDRIKVNALAVLAKVPNADPSMNFYFGLDDVTIKGSRAMPFKFAEPPMYKLSEWKPYISKKTFRKGDTFKLSGQWPLDAENVKLRIVSFTDNSKIYLNKNLNFSNNLWTLKPFKLTFPEGLYRGMLQAIKDGEVLSETEFTIHMAPENIGGKHPRLWFNSEKLDEIKARLATEKFSGVANNIKSRAKSYRTSNPVEMIIFDIDQFPEEEWLATLDGWFNRVGIWRWSVYYNALAYCFFNDREAGIYAKDFLVKICKFPYWIHPWFIKRGRHIYYPLGEAGTELAIGYDLCYDLMDENERAVIRRGLFKNIIQGCHRGYVVNNLTTNHTSNWVANIASGSLICQTAIFGDGPDVLPVEPYLTGAMFKEYAMIQSGFGRDGGYGEPNGYYVFTMDGLSEALPAIENVFNVDMSEKINGSYTELIWAGIVKKKQVFYFGKSGGSLRPATNWAWLLPKYKDPLLGWYYHFMKGGETLKDVIYDTENVPRKDPFDQNPVRVFRDLGTTVFKSGWEPDDFVFVMRSGTFYNHQFAEQGSFWLSDRGSLFIERRHGSTEPYVGAVLYDSHYIQAISHSTILIDKNNQGQRTGDVLNFAGGFEDYALITHFLDGKYAAFSSGDIGRLYWDKVKEMKRNVLYLKPRTLLMLDTVVPAERDVDVTLLYHPELLKSITPGEDISKITKDGNVLNILHLNPEQRTVKSVETPHYLYTLLRKKPLEREGMLTLETRTSRIPLIVANLLTSTSGNTQPNISTEKGEGFIRGQVDGIPFVFSTRLNTRYVVDDITTDALAFTRNDSNIFAVMCCEFLMNGKLLLRSEEPVSFELSPDGIKYYHNKESEVTFGVSSKPTTITVNGEQFSDFMFDAERGVITLTLPGGGGMVGF